MGRELGDQSSVQTFAEVNDMPGNFADFSRFESIPSQEVLNVHDHVTPGLQAVTSDKHKRSVSIDYKQFVSYTILLFCSHFIANSNNNLGMVIIESFINPECPSLKILIKKHFL